MFKGYKCHNCKHRRYCKEEYYGCYEREEVVDIIDETMASRTRQATQGKP